MSAHSPPARVAGRVGSHRAAPAGGRLMAALVGLAVLLAASGPGCSSEADDTTPSGALQLFLDAMERSQHEPEGLRQAYQLLSKSGRDQLRARARLASVLSGRSFEPWEMLAQGRFHLRFAPRVVDGMREQVDGATAIVVVQGSREEQRAEVPMVLEDGHWRVKLELPDVGETPGGHR